MTDRELLEMAAKACGMTTHEALGKIGKPISLYSAWDPLNDDGDALRLAYHLGLDVDMCACWVQYEGDEEMESIEFLGGSLENVRRAIVRAAAAIGSAM